MADFIGFRVHFHDLLVFFAQLFHRIAHFGLLLLRDFLLLILLFEQLLFLQRVDRVVQNVDFLLFHGAEVQLLGKGSFAESDFLLPLEFVVFRQFLLLKETIGGLSVEVVGHKGAIFRGRHYNVALIAEAQVFDFAVVFVVHKHSHVLLEIKAVVNCVPAVFVADEQKLIVFRELKKGGRHFRYFDGLDGPFLPPADHIEIAEVPAFHTGQHLRALRVVVHRAQYARGVPLLFLLVQLLLLQQELDVHLILLRLLELHHSDSVALILVLLQIALLRVAEFFPRHRHFVDVSVSAPYQKLFAHPIPANRTYLEARLKQAIRLYCT